MAAFPCSLMIPVPVHFLTAAPSGVRGRLGRCAPLIAARIRPNPNCRGCSTMAARSSSKFVGAMIVILLVIHGSVRAREGSSSCRESERRALLAVKSNMYDPGGWLSSWTGDDCCEWEGVTCDDRAAATGGGRHVTRLDLRYPRADDDGALPGPSTKRTSKVNPSLLDLKHLKHLDLSMNDFGGAQIPRLLASLVQLEHLNLSNAGFGGLIPPHLGNLSSLQQLDLGGFSNTLRAGELDWLSRIPSLQYLDMACVDFSESTNWLHQINSIRPLQVLRLGNADLPFVPSPLPLFNLTSMSMLDLSSCRNLSNTMLKWLSHARNLRYLYLQSCHFGLDVEVVGAAVGALTNLKELNLAKNDITGEVSTIVVNVSRSLRHLDLGFNSLSGEIPPTVGDLLHLEFLDLQHNFITGEMPRNMGNLSKLVTLSTSENNISGRIPETLGDLRNLESLDLSKNNISGQVPNTIGNLRSLQFLCLDDNSITGQIPETIGNLQNLKELSLDDNSITGQIPETIGEVYSLEILSLPKNYLTGQIPRILGDLCNLSVLDLSYNDLVGDVTGLIDSWSNCAEGSPLSSMYLNSNNLSGIIPPSLGQLSEMMDLDLSLNSLQGNISEAHFSNLTNLYYLDISFNSMNVILPDDWLPPFSAAVIDMSYCHIGTKFPDWIRTQESLGSLHLSGAGLWGHIPDWFPEFLKDMSSLNLSSNYLSGPLPSVPATPLLSLDLSSNSFQGPIPLSFANATDLEALILSHNHLNGDLPPFFCNMTQLEVMILSDNDLFGNISSCNRSSLASLQSLHLSSNHLWGGFPSFLKHCEELLILDLGENEFSGEIPNWVGINLKSLRILRLRSNQFHGNIPASLSNLTSLQVLDLASNHLFGRIPSSLGHLSAMRVIQNHTKPIYLFYREDIVIAAKGSSLQYTAVLSLVTSIDLSNNDLSGEIPEELTNLLGLRFLSFSNNHLTGRIPTEIGSLSQLESLDLSVNNLTGAIPSSFSALSFLSYLNLSYNNLSGKIPRGSQLETFGPSIYSGNRNLCGWPLLECPSDAELAEDDRSGQDKLETMFVIISIILGFAVGFWLSVGVIFTKHSVRIALFQSMDKITDWLYVQFAVKLSKLKSKL